MRRARIRGEGIERALACIPPRIRERLGCDFFIGADPVFAGLHDYDEVDQTVNGIQRERSYRNTPHACYEHHTIDKTVTVVLPLQFDVAPPTVIHELGHVLDWGLGQEHEAYPVTPYATYNRQEAFAEAFAAWLMPEHWRGELHDIWFQYYLGARDRLLEHGQETIALFEELGS